MKKYLVTLNVCGEIKTVVVEVNFETLEEFANWIIEGIECYFIILQAVSEDTKVDIAIKPENIESIVEFNDEERMIKMNDKLIQLAEPLIKYLKEKYDPHCKIEISSDAVRVVRTERQEIVELHSYLRREMKKG